MNLFHYRSRVERERARRIKLTIWAYAYEFRSESVVSDGEFDKECLMVNLSIDTGNAEMDKWWRKEFNPHTGQWITKHPNLNRVKELYDAHYNTKRRRSA